MKGENEMESRQNNSTRFQIVELEERIAPAIGMGLGAGLGVAAETHGFEIANAHVSASAIAHANVGFTGVEV
jgi:hypothetical protein